MRAVIVANGALVGDARLRAIWQRADLRIAADGGAVNARNELGRAPEVIVGDLDSLDAETREWADGAGAEVIQHPIEKDKTDLELALEFARERGADEVTILGATDGRLDHFLANVSLLSQAEAVRIVAGAGELWASAGRAEIEGNKGDIVSLIPLDAAVEGIVTTDLYYPLQEETLQRGSTRGISNVMTGSRAQVRWRQGLMLVVHLMVDRGSSQSES